ncbi:MAG: GNAT family N-acetyltransferase [Anaerolineales bacterium]|nr:MAG: GNAT family N-acetyltransferase [Anaerolineales bacterium]
MAVIPTKLLNTSLPSLVYNHTLMDLSLDLSFNRFMYPMNSGYLGNYGGSMDLRIERVNQTNEPQLLRYSAEHGPEHDGSFLPGRDFAISQEYPSYLLLKDETAVGAVTLMQTPRYLSVKKGRFSIFHSVLNTEGSYQQLLDAIRAHFRDLKSVYLFLAEKKQASAAIMLQLGFQIERFSFVLEKEGVDLKDLTFPDGYTIQQLDPSDQVGISQFAQCVNEEFSELAGHTPSTAEDIRTWFDDETYLKGGICLLKWNQEPVGTMCMMREIENPQAGELIAFGIISQHRGLGLGRKLLRYAVDFANSQGLNPTILSVNAENKSALKLYQSEGFILTESVVCYALDCS